jgi:hypothetical protein
MFLPQLGTKRVLRLSNLVYLGNTFNVYTDEVMVFTVIIITSRLMGGL